MKAHYDHQAKALYVYAHKDDNAIVERTVDAGPSMNIDIAEDGEIFGYEFLLSDELIELEPVEGGEAE